MTCGSAKSQRMTGFVYTVRWVMPGNAVRTEGIARRNAASKRAGAASTTTVRHLAIVDLHGPERVCGPDQVLSRKTGHDYQSLASHHIEIPLLSDHAPPGVIGPL